MSALLGILDLTGRPLDADRLAPMQRALVHAGPDGGGTWLAGPVGLGQLMRHNTPESIHESLPLVEPSGDLVLVAAARIDNRSDLCRRFGIPPAEWATTPDSTLILRAYQKWGTDCPDRLLGDWAFALWDDQERRFFLARDHHGNSALYYHQNPYFFAFASSLKGLLALPGVPRRIDPQHLVRALVAWPPEGESTAYVDIWRLPPAHAMIVTAGQTRVWRYWRLENAPDVRFPSDQDYIDAFLEIYAEAVRCRLRSHRPVGIQLSGGLDSTSVAALAARELAERGGPLLAFSSVPKYDISGATRPNRLGDETPLIEAISRFVGNIEPTYVTAEQISPLAGIRRQLEILPEPIHAGVNFYWIVALFEAARQRHVGTMLNGQGGNDTISWSGNRRGYLHGLARTGQWGTWWQEVTAWRNLHRASWWRAFRTQVVRPLVPPSLSRFYRRVRDGAQPWMNYSAIHPDFAESIDLAGQMAAHGHDPTFMPARDSRQQRYASLKPGRTMVGAISTETGLTFGLEIRDPTVDKRVLEFCLGIPDRLYGHQGRERLLVRRAMAGLVPDEVLSNPLRGQQAADAIWRVRKDAANVQSLLDTLEKHPAAREYLDLARMQRVFDTAQERVDPTLTIQVATILLRGLNVGLFLLQVE